MKDWIKKHREITIVVMIVFIMALFITNICLACIYPDCGANVFATTSGWLSIISAVIIGCIAVWQSKTYTVISLKGEFKVLITKEIEDLITILDDIEKLSTLTAPLAIMLKEQGGINSSLRIQLEAKISLDCLSELFESRSKKIQVLNVKTPSFVDLIECNCKMITYIKNRYSEALDNVNNDSRLSKDIDEISKHMISWLIDFSKKRQTAVAELIAIKEQLDKCKNVSEINCLQINVDKKSQKVLKLMFDKINEIANNDCNKENNNG